jgi:hypothetical protein
MGISLSRYKPTPEEEKMYGIQNQIVNDVVKQMSKTLDDELKDIVLTYAIPPIKGEITAGKIKWRGIRLCNQNTFEYTKTWVEQRGVRIGREIIINYNIKL